MTLDMLVQGRRAKLSPTEKEKKQGVTLRDCTVFGVRSGQGGVSLLVSADDNNDLVCVAAYRVSFNTEENNGR